MTVLFGRTPFLLSIWMRPCTWMTSFSRLSMAVSNWSVVETVTVRPPAPPVVPFCPNALSDANPVGAVSAATLTAAAAAGSTITPAAVESRASDPKVLRFMSDLPHSGTGRYDGRHGGRRVEG